MSVSLGRKWNGVDRSGAKGSKDGRAERAGGKGSGTEGPRGRGWPEFNNIFVDTL